MLKSFLIWLSTYIIYIILFVDVVFSDRNISEFLSRIDDLKPCLSCACWAKLSMFTLATKKTLVHGSCWAGQATNESQWWVNNQLPPQTLSVTTKPVDWFPCSLLTLRNKIALFVENVDSEGFCIDVGKQSILKDLTHSNFICGLKAIGFSVQTVVLDNTKARS